MYLYLSVYNFPTCVKLRHLENRSGPSTNQVQLPFSRVTACYTRDRETAGWSPACAIFKDFQGQRLHLRQYIFLTLSGNIAYPRPYPLSYVFKGAAWNTGGTVTEAGSCEVPKVNLNPTCLRSFCGRALRKGGWMRGHEDELRIAAETFKHYLQAEFKEQILFLFACFMFLRKGTLMYSLLGQR